MSNNPAGRPKGSTTKEPGRTSTVHIPERVRVWARFRCSLAQLVADAPKWYDTMIEQAEELRELREGIKRKDALILKLSSENADLMKFKDKVREKIREKSLMGDA